MSRTTHAFDTLIYAKRLKKAGFTEKQAETQAEAFADVVNDNLATKHDLKKLETKLFVRLSTVIVTVVGFFSGIVILFH